MSGWGGGGGGGVARLDICLLLISSTHKPPECLPCHFISVPVCYSLLCHLSSFCNVHRGSQSGCKSAGCNTTRDPEEQPLPSFPFKNVVSLSIALLRPHKVPHSLTHSLSAHHFILQILLLIVLYKEKGIPQGLLLRDFCRLAVC